MPKYLYLLLCLAALKSCTAQVAHSNSLSWSSPTQPAGVVVSGFGVYRSKVPGSYTRGTPLVKVTAPSYVDLGPGLKAGETNFYVVTVLCAACSGDKESAFSVEVRAVTPADPLSPVAIQGASFVVVSR